MNLRRLEIIEAKSYQQRSFEVLSKRKTRSPSPKDGVSPILGVTPTGPGADLCMKS